MTDALVAYRAAMALATEMAHRGIINGADLERAEALLSKRHGIKDKSIYRLNKLICTLPRANMSDGREDPEDE